jgi:hypothetical protein
VVRTIPLYEHATPPSVTKAKSPRTSATNSLSNGVGSGFNGGASLQDADKPIQPVQPDQRPLRLRATDRPSYDLIVTHGSATT